MTDLAREIAEEISEYVNSFQYRLAISRDGLAEDPVEEATKLISAKLAEANTARDARDARAKKAFAWALDAARTVHDELRGTAVRSNAVDAARYCARDCVGYIEEALALLGGDDDPTKDD
jgi:hypothetical protein